MAKKKPSVTQKAPTKKMTSAKPAGKPATSAASKPAVKSASSAAAGLARTRGMAKAQSAEAAGRRTAGVPVASRKPLPRQPGESVQSYNDRIRNAPLRDFFSNLGKTQPVKKGDRRPKGAYGGYEEWNGTRWVKVR